LSVDGPYAFGHRLDNPAIHFFADAHVVARIE
jgi:hypothetical protein